MHGASGVAPPPRRRPTKEQPSNRTTTCRQNAQEAHIPHSASDLPATDRCSPGDYRQFAGKMGARVRRRAAAAPRRREEKGIRNGPVGDASSRQKWPAGSGRVTGGVGAVAGVEWEPERVPEGRRRRYETRGMPSPAGRHLVRRFWGISG
ncbi:hypothetical protein Zmor_017104 [Zophobas morio]|uniref:Uncharacterized protein n=1 Tax=Zophobas morio TaxID=2755281 RepID=A0AA38IAY8_9CUCU|nr:hypothetical protein Zmor_017104 [Zophobas morio]